MRNASASYQNPSYISAPSETNPVTPAVIHRPSSPANEFVMHEYDEQAKLRCELELRPQRGIEGQSSDSVLASSHTSRATTGRGCHVDQKR
jgi:hypothetical protein